MKVSELIDREFVSVAPSATFAEVAKKMRQQNLRCVPVVDQNQVLGIITDRDIVTKIVANDVDPSAVRVGIVLSRSSVPAIVSPDADAADVVRVMAERQQACTCVSDGNDLVGLLSIDALSEVGPIR